MKAGLLMAQVSRHSAGVWEVVANHARYLSSEARVDARIYGLEAFDSRELLEAEGELNTKLFPVSGPPAFGFASGLYPALAAAKVDLIHSHGVWMYPSVASGKLHRCRKTPHMISPHGMLDPWAVRHSRWKKYLAAWLYESSNLKSAACIHALCDAELHGIRAYGLRNPVCLIPNGIDLPSVMGRGSPPPWHGCVEEGKKVLLYLGRLHPKKGLIPLIQAISRIRRELPAKAAEWVVVIAGWDQGAHKAGLEDLVQQYGLQDYVSFIGPQFEDNKTACFSSASAFVLPSVSEGLPVSVLEAWSHACPVLMTPECHLPEGFEEGAAVRMRSGEEGVTEGLRHLLGMTDHEQREMGGRGRQLVERRFQWRVVVQELKRVYDWVLGGGAVPTCVAEYGDGIR